MPKQRLYPPYIEGKISAQTGTELAIPFEMNRAVGADDFDFIRAQIKTVSTNQTIGVFDSIKIVDNVAYFNCGDALTIGQFYKVQLAYVSSNKNLISMFNENGSIGNGWSTNSVTNTINKVASVENIKGYYPSIYVGVDDGGVWAEQIQYKNIAVKPNTKYSFLGFYTNANTSNNTNKITGKIIDEASSKELASTTTTFNKTNTSWKYFLETFMTTGNSVSISFESSSNHKRSLSIYNIKLIEGELNVGYYSTVGIFKYTTVPQAQIEGLSKNEINLNLQIYQGKYTSNDPTEKEYSYSFDLYNDIEMVYSSGEKIHNTNDSVDQFILPVNLSLGVQYNLIYNVITSNNLKASASYYIMDSVLTEIPINLNGKLTATLNRDEGYVSIDLISVEGTGQNIGGEFRLLRFVGSEYEIIDNFIIQSVISSNPLRPTHIYKDFTIAQGVEYRYALQQCSNTVFSQKLYSNYIIADYEDMFLYDGERQLKLRFNPKVSSFKTFIQESKLDTLGGRYPYFFRNGNTQYKDFPISALISMLSDENENFYPWKEEFERDERGSELRSQESQNIKTTDLISLNLRREREFKLEVLNWLNNGKPKLFRSPVEGNYIVRLMNVTMSPNDTLGRMLHTCNAQAYEIMENTFTNLLDQQLISPINDIKQIMLGEQTLSKNTSLEMNTLHLVVIGDPDSRFKLTFKDGTVETIIVGHTMIYDAPVQDGNPILLITNIADNNIRVQYDMSSQLVYPLRFKDKDVTAISQEQKAAQFIGSDINTNILANIQKNYDNYNIMSLTISAKISADISGVYSDTTIQTDASGTKYTREGAILNEKSGLVYIKFQNSKEEVELDLSQNILYEDLTNKYPIRWKLDSFGNITLTCDVFDDSRFKPESIRLGNGVYANMYYSVAKYN